MKRTTTCVIPQSGACAVELAVKYINDCHLPDKAIDVIDEAGARDRPDAGKQAQENR
ncbi:hypothetical protein ACVXHB_13410 [Escherichia coli]